MKRFLKALAFVLKELAEGNWVSIKENGALTSEEKLEEKVADLLRG